MLVICIMKKVNFFNFPSYNIDIKKNTDDSIFLRKLKKAESKRLFTKIKFSSWCKSVNIENEKLNIRVTFKSAAS